MPLIRIDVVIVQVTSRPRDRGKKEALYAGLVKALERERGLRPDDLAVSITENTDEDWSFGRASAQFLTVEL